MDISKEKDDCAVSQATPSKQKKLKQALLPFHTLSPSDPENLKNKKRKLSSSSPSGCKSEKISKLEKKENLQNISINKETTDESKENEKDQDDSKESDDESKERKSEEKSVMKPDALLKYIKRTSPSGTLLKQFNLDKNVPVLIINRCDDDIRKSQDSSSQNHALNNSVDSTNTYAKDSMIETTGLNDKTLLGSKDIDVRDSGRGSSESCKIDNTDTETESSSSEDEDDDDDNDNDNDSKKSNDDLDEVSGKENGNNSSLEKTPKSSKNAEKKNNIVRRLTPKQLEKRMESEKKKEERKKLKEEREKQRIEERKERRAKKEAEREQKRKEKEEKKLKKQMEIEQKQEEKERKEKAKEEERLEAERKKQKAASTFISFFVPKNQEVKSAVEEKNISACNFMPFEIKADMKMAPCRRTFSNDEKITFEDLFSKNNEEIGKLYIAELKNDKSKIRRSAKTWPLEAKDDEVKDEVTIIGDDVMDENVDQPSSVLPRHRPKLLSFSENRRPPYWGTWRKKSKIVNPRRPFAKDSQYFDYEVDSDEEWEEEEPGESLHGSDDEKDKEEDGTDDYVVDNEFMVPHGYLSDEEISESVSPETQKCKLQILKEQFEAEMKEKTSKVKPQIIGMIWQGPLNSYPEEMNPSVLNFLKMRQVWIKETPIILEALANSNSSNTEAPSSAKKDKEKTPGPKKMRCPDEAVPDLIRLLHGNTNGRSFLIKEFMTYWERKHPAEEQKLTQISVGKKIRELATRMLCPEKGPMYLKRCWMVSEEIRKKYGVEELTLPNKWLYELTPMRKSKVTETAEPAEKIEKEVDREKEKDQKNKEKEKKTTPLITQFTKKITQEEMKKQLSVKSVPPLTPKPSVIPNKPGKRVALISVPRGGQFPKSSTISISSKVSQETPNLERPGSSNSPIMIDDLPERNTPISQQTDHHVLETQETCNLSGDKNSVKENQSTELNNKPDQMELKENK
ncbi:chromatin assembly factor 1 subunit A-B-like [Chelonus insularis]|uniref:chromatin assembly factor 1 subunit A-B-like n=1 Tax=Chelonus insularis TaxID=460826 RepID=UPI00158E630F|nr:chromatin assembly factor 1 subunit A-B-like [Chelonus insularis]